jgi:hypothetical protein
MRRNHEKKEICSINNYSRSNSSYGHYNCCNNKKHGDEAGTVGVNGNS